MFTRFISADYRCSRFDRLSWMLPIQSFIHSKFSKFVFRYIVCSSYFPLFLFFWRWTTMFWHHATRWIHCSFWLRPLHGRWSKSSRFVLVSWWYTYRSLLISKNLIMNTLNSKPSWFLNNDFWLFNSLNLSLLSNDISFFVKLNVHFLKCFFLNLFLFLFFCLSFLIKKLFFVFLLVEKGFNKCGMSIPIESSHQLLFFLLLFFISI